METPVLKPVLRDHRGTLYHLEPQADMTAVEALYVMLFLLQAIAPGRHPLMLAEAFQAFPPGVQRHWRREEASAIVVAQQVEPGIRGLLSPSA